MSFGKRVLTATAALAVMVAVLIWSGNGFLLGDVPQKVQAAVADAWNHRPPGYTQTDRSVGRGLPLRDVDMGDLARKAAAVHAVTEPAEGYDPGLFGAWTTSEGCDTPDRVLARDLSQVSYAKGSRCEVSSGVLIDPYRGRTVRFLSGADTGPAVLVDHVVPRSVAWRTGASGWTGDRREAFANDELNLLAVDRPAGEARLDMTLAQFAVATDDAGEMLLDRANLCDFTARYVTVVHRYGLGMHQEDKDMAIATLNECAA